MKKLLFCFGTRPEAVKMAPAITEAKENCFKVEVLLTGQHVELVLPFLAFFEIKENYRLEVMQEGQSLNSLFAKILNQASDILVSSNPDAVIVQGDTSSTTACALAAFHHQIPVFHIEAGLRTHELYSPFPEEINRQIVSTFATLNFCPSSDTKKNLVAEGRKNIFVTGNTSLDSLRLARKKISSQEQELKDKYHFVNLNSKIILLTCHRRENHGEKLLEIIRSIIEISKNQSVEFVIPVHLNPNVKSFFEVSFKDIPNVHLLAPLDYLDFIWWMEKAFLIITDSGGVQEEGPSFKKPILVLRESTERPEVIVTGQAKLVGSDFKKIVNTVKQCLDNKNYYDSFGKDSSPYGDGFSSVKIVQAIKDFFENS